MKSWYNDTRGKMSKDTEEKEHTVKLHGSKYEYDLYNEADDIANKVIRFKRISMPNHEEKWKLFEDNKTILTIDGNSISEQERLYLRSVDGANLIISLFKKGKKTQYSLMSEVKKILK